MKVTTDFATHKSLGNVFDESKPNNHKSFENAEVLYKANRASIDAAIVRTATMQTPVAGMSLSIPTTALPNRGFTKGLKFLVTSVANDEIACTLTEVEH